MADLSTSLIHHGYRPPEGFDAVAPAVHKASTVLFPDVKSLRSREWKDKSAYTYGLHGTPTTYTLEERLATLEGGRFCVLAPSGLSAIALVDMAFLRQGDQVLLPDNAYGPGKAFAEGEMRHWGVAVDYYDPMKPDDLAARLTPATRMVGLEAPGSITLEYPDLPALSAVVAAHNGTLSSDRPAVTVLDNTWGAGIAFNAFDLGVDVSVQALTKYPSGGSDMMMGSVITRDERLHRQVQSCHMRQGLCVGVNDAELVLRGLQTIALRYAAQDAATRELATWMQTQAGVAQVFHPALPGSPGHASWKRDAVAAACLFGVLLDSRYDASRVDAFCDDLRLFRLGWSWAGPISLCAPYHVLPMRHRMPWPHKQTHLIRFAVGLESVDDLRTDLSQALAKLVS
ncbi:MAG: PLP-dependent transferase [Burkholderiaceae bacterium]